MFLPMKEDRFLQSGFGSYKKVGCKYELKRYYVQNTYGMYWTTKKEEAFHLYKEAVFKGDSCVSLERWRLRTFYDLGLNRSA